MPDQTTVPQEGEQPQEEVVTTQPVDTERLSIQDLRAQIPRLALLAAGFFAGVGDGINIGGGIGHN